MSQIRIGGLGGFAGFDLSSLDLLLRANGIPECEWPFALYKVGLLTGIASKYFAEQSKSKDNRE